MRAEDIKVSTLSLSPVYGEYPHYDRITGYAASLSVTASTTTFDLVAEMMEAGAGAGVTQMWTSFRSTKLPELKVKVREMALAAAKDKARQIADTLGAPMVRVVAVAETPGGNPYYWNGGAVPNAVGTVEGRSDVQLQPTTQELNLTITITWELG